MPRGAWRNRNRFRKLRGRGGAACCAGAPLLNLLCAPAPWQWCLGGVRAAELLLRSLQIALEQRVR